LNELTRSARVIVTQLGARRRYAVPRMLYRHGALSRFYTDSCFPSSFLGAASNKMLPSRLRRRIVYGIPFSLVRSDPMVNFRCALSPACVQHERYALANEMFGRKMIEWGTGDANIVYGMLGSGVLFWRYAKAHGLTIAVDMFITPVAHKIVCREREAFPDWEQPRPRADYENELIDGMTREAIEAADLLICPSETVCDGVSAFVAEDRGIAMPSMIVVPYGLRASRIRAGNPIQGRILFAGAAELRKGIHYLAAAAQLLAASGHFYEFRVAGLVNERVRKHPATRSLVFLGHLSREQLDEEYRLADVFVLPTLAEGSPAVVHEALAAGVPVVTTRSAGSAVTDGLEGFIVPERDSFALAAAIEKIVFDRSLRSAMSEAARATAARFDEGPWGQRLLAALETLCVQ